MQRATPVGAAVMSASDGTESDVLSSGELTDVGKRQT